MTCTRKTLSYFGYGMAVDRKMAKASFYYLEIDLIFPEGVMKYPTFDSYQRRIDDLK